MMICRKRIYHIEIMEYLLKYSIKTKPRAKVRINSFFACLIYVFSFLQTKHTLTRYRNLSLLLYIHVLDAI